MSQFREEKDRLLPKQTTTKWKEMDKPRRERMVETDGQTHGTTGQ